MGFREELQRDVVNILGSIKKHAEHLKAEADKAGRIERLWQDLHSFIDKNWPFHILHLIDREFDLLKQAVSQEERAIQIINEVYEAAKDQAEAVKRRYPSHLEEACKAAGLDLDPESRHPEYSLDRHFFQLKVDEKKWIARLSDPEGTLASLPADVGAVVDAILRERKRIFDRPFNGRKFLKQLRTQYLAILKKSGQPDGSSVPIRHITRRLRKNVKGFRSDEFLVDLSRLVEHGPFDIEGYRLDLQHTKDTKRGMLLYGRPGCGYVGFVVFRRI